MQYTKDHEWVLVEGDVATVGITDYAQNALGDVVFVEVPEVGTVFVQGDEVSVVESVKAASEVYAPISGEIVDVNADLDGEPGLVNTSPEGDGWFFKIKISDQSELDELLSNTDYQSLVSELE